MEVELGPKVVELSLLELEPMEVELVLRLFFVGEMIVVFLLHEQLVFVQLFSFHKFDVELL